MIVQSGILHFFGKAWARAFALFVSQLSVQGVNLLLIKTKNVVTDSHTSKNGTSIDLFAFDLFASRQSQYVGIDSNGSLRA